MTAEKPASRAGKGLRKISSGRPTASARPIAAKVPIGQSCRRDTHAADKKAKGTEETENPMANTSMLSMSSVPPIGVDSADSTTMP